MASQEARFKKAVDIVKTLPKDGPVKPGHELAVIIASVTSFY